MLGASFRLEDRTLLSLSPSSTAITATPAVFLHPVTLTATVAPAPAAAGMPTGSVTFLDGASPLGTMTLGVVNGVDQASLTTSTLALGAHSIVAVYGGDGTYAPSTSPLLLSGTITTVAGTGAAGYGGDGGPALAAQLSGPTALAVDSSGDLYVTDTGNNRVREITPAGAITTLAGNGAAGSPVAGSAATGTPIGTPIGLAVDPSGNLFATFGSGNPVLKVDHATHTVSYFANASGVNATTQSRLATDAAGNVYLSSPGDFPGHSFVGVGLLELDRLTQQYTALAFPGIGGLAINSAGDVTGVDYEAATHFGIGRLVAGQNSTAKIVPGPRFVGSSGDGGPAINALVNDPRGVGLDSAGDVYIADTGNNRVRVISPSGVITTVAGNGAAGFGGDNGAPNAAKFNAPSDVAVDAAGDVFIADTANNRVRELKVFTVAPGNVTTNLSSSPASQTYGQPVTFTAVVSAVGTPAPTGTVSFTDGSTFLGAATLAVVNGVDQASLNTSALPAGSPTITATYGGDSVYNAGTPATLALTVVTSPTLTTLSVSNPSTTYGQPVTFTAAVTDVPAGAGTPTGSVAFMEGGTTFATAPLSATGVATFTTPYIWAGTHSFHASYGGDANDQGGDSAPRVVAVAKAPLTVRANDVTKAYGQANPAFTVSDSGFVLGEGPSILGGQLNFRTAATLSSEVGTYPVTPGGLLAINYALSFVPGTLTVQAVTQVAYAGTDATTGGSWKGVYGSDGSDVIGDTGANNPNLPAYASVDALTGSGGNAIPAPTATWLGSTADPRALRVAALGSTDRIAAAWYSSSTIVIHVNIAQGRPRLVSLYFLDWDHQGRTESVSLSDTAGTVLDTRTLSNFQNGVYLSWSLAGNCYINVVNTNPVNAVVSGLFFGGAPNPTSASYIATDTTTRGNWKSSYGGEGYWVAQDQSAGNPNIPASVASVTTSGLSDYVWTPSSTDPSYLQRAAAGSTDRIGAGWYTYSSMTFAVELADGNAHRVSLYAQDVNGDGRTETVQVLDTATGAVLDTRVLSSFQTGVYLSWQLTGSVTIKVTNNGPTNAVVSGLFFSGGIAPASVSFLGADTTTEGNWKSAYGADGYDLAQDLSPNNPTLPPYAWVTPVGQSDYVWTPSSTDPRYLQRAAAGSTDRIGAGWYAWSSMTFAVELADNKAHRVSLYAQDVNGDGRTETVQVLDTATGAVLDTRVLSSFQTGVYLSWNVSGSITIRVTNTGPTNAVVSGLFLDPAR